MRSPVTLGTHALTVALLASACAPATSSPPANPHPGVVTVPSASPRAAAEPAGGSLPDAVRRPPPTPPEDPFEYYVGRWEGTVNETLQTRLWVKPNGAFVVTSEAHPNQRACELNGRLRAEPEVIFMEVAESTCSVQSVGTTLERRVVTKRPHEFVVASPTHDLTVHYRRLP